MLTNFFLCVRVSVYKTTILPKHTLDLLDKLIARIITSCEENGNFQKLYASGVFLRCFLVRQDLCEF